MPARMMHLHGRARDAVARDVPGKRRATTHATGGRVARRGTQVDRVIFTPRLLTKMPSMAPLVSNFFAPVPLNKNAVYVPVNTRHFLLPRKYS